MCLVMSEWGREAKATLWPGLTGKTKIQAHFTQGKKQREARSYVARWCKVTALLKQSCWHEVLLHQLVQIYPLNNDEKEESG